MSDIEDNPIHKAVSTFVMDVESIRTLSAIGGLVLSGVRSVVTNKYNSFLQSCPKVEGKENGYHVSSEKLNRQRRMEAECKRGHRATQILPRSLIVTLVSQYDAFLISMIRAFYVFKPVLINSSQRAIELSELMAFSSIEEAKESVIDSELEALLRESHQQQFEWLEKRFSIETLRAFPAWSEFVEVTQRRNLFVHSDGRISKQYLKVCAANGASVEGLRVGDQLEADSSYVRRSVDVLFEVAVKLSQVLWRKTLSEQKPQADESLVHITYSLLERKRYGLAITLLDFSFDVIKQYSTPDVRLRLLVNRANAYRLSGNQKRCNQLVEGEDWSAYDPSFRMAAHVLKGELEAALNCMEKVGAHGSISKSDYREWPLFEGIRSERSFADTFEQIFLEKLIPDEVNPEEKDDDLPTALANFSLDRFSDQDIVLNLPPFAKPN